MLKVIFLSIFTCVLLSATAQVQTQVIGDSVFIHSNAGKGELILQNRTDSVNGFLFNKGAGRTEFRRGLVKISDSVYLIGKDTLHLNNAGGTVSPANVYYVSRKFTGAAREVVSGNTLASVTSTNTSYNSQLASAIPGSMVFSYPDPFSARNAALDAISAGTITSVEIVILEGNSYTIGSNDSTKNGSTDGLSPNNGTVADVQFSSTALTTDPSISSIMKNKINMYFSEGASLSYINSAYPIYCYYQSDTNNAAFRSGIYGLGSFYQVYGEVNGFSAAFSLINNRSALVDFHAHEVIIQQYSGFTFADYSIYNIDIDNLVTTDADVFNIGKNRADAVKNGSESDAPRILNIKLKNCKFGKGQIPYPDSNDSWYFINLTSNAAIEGTVVTIDIDNLYLKSSDYSPLFFLSTHSLLYNVNFTVNISNLIQRDSHINYFGLSGGLIASYSPDTAINNTIVYNIKSGNIDAPLLGIMSFSAYSTDMANKNNNFYINAGNLQKNNSVYVGGLFKVTSESSLLWGEPLKIKVNGNFKSLDSNSVIDAFNDYLSFPFPCKYQFSGKYETVANVPVVHFYSNTGKIVAITDALLINNGSAPGILADSVCTGALGTCQDPAGTPINIPVYIKNVHATAAPSTNVQQVGDSIKVVPDIVDFF